MQREERIREFQNSRREILTTKEQLSHWEIFDLLKKSHGIQPKEEPKANSYELAPAMQEVATQNKTPANTQEVVRAENYQQVSPTHESHLAVTRKPVIQQIRLDFFRN